MSPYRLPYSYRCSRPCYEQQRTSRSFHVYYTQPLHAVVSSIERRRSYSAQPKAPPRLHACTSVQFLAANMFRYARSPCASVFESGTSTTKHTTRADRRRGAADVSGVNVCVLLLQKRRAAIASCATAFPAPAAPRSGSRALVRPAQNNNSTPRRASRSRDGERESGGAARDLEIERTGRGGGVGPKLARRRRNLSSERGFEMAEMAEMAEITEKKRVW